MPTAQTTPAQRRALWQALADMRPPAQLNAKSLHSFLAARGVLLDRLQQVMQGGPPLDAFEQGCADRVREQSQAMQQVAEAQLQTLRAQLQKVQAARARKLDPQAGPTGKFVNRVG